MPLLVLKMRVLLYFITEMMWEDSRPVLQVAEVLPLHKVKLSPEDEEVENVLTAVPVEVENETEYVVDPPIENKRQEMRI